MNLASSRSAFRRPAVAVLVAAVLIGAGPLSAAEPDTAAAFTEAAFPIADAAFQKGWAGEGVEPADWKAVPQPDLAEALKRAPALKLEDVAPPPGRCWCGHQPYVCPNPEGKTWDMLFPYYNKYRGEQQVVIHDFGTGKTRIQVVSTRQGEEVLTREPIGFHMQPAYWTHGQLVFEIWGPVLFVVYDPAEDRFTRGVKPFGDEVTNGRCVLGPGGLLYGMGWTKGGGAFVAYRFDPRTCEATRFPPFGPSNPNRKELYRQVAMVGDWLYAGIGHQPWHLVALNVKTKQGRLLATTVPDERGHGIVLTRMKGGVAGLIRHPVSVEGVETFDKDEFTFWLHDGKMHPRTGDVPPWSDQPAEPDRTGTYRWAREFQRWGDFVPDTPPPEFKRDASDPDAHGHVELSYRLPGEKAWRPLAYDVKMYPGIVRLLTEVNDHVLFATDEGYGQHVFYDVTGRRLQRVGGTLSPYSMGIAGGRLFVSGYPNSQMYVYDLCRPLGLRRDPPNPRFLGYTKCDTHCPMAGTVPACDGRVYCAGTTYGRRREGGGLGWVDTQTGDLGGTALEGHRIFWMTSAAGGRYLLLSTKLGDQGQLFCWDTQTHAFLYKKAILGGGRPGPVEEALPGGLVLGHHDTGVLYGLRARTGEVLWQKPVPEGPITGFSQVRKHAYAFRRGPRGHVWSFFGDVLVRIDPRDGRVEPVGRTSPAQIAFAGGDVYIAGGHHLRRIVLPDEAP